MNRPEARTAKPVKRSKALQALSRDHHHGLLLCWKIRTGFSREVAPDRISEYVRHFFRSHLQQHFREEEKLVFGLLEADNELRKKAESQHRRLLRLCRRLEEEPPRVTVTLGEIEEELEQHIRFEERKLFPLVEEQLDAPALLELERSLEEQHRPFRDQWKDVFWQ